LLKQKRIVPILADGRLGIPEHGPYDVIHIGGAIDSMPEEILAQLAPGGIMWAPVGPRVSGQQIMLYEKDANGIVESRSIMEVRYGSLTTVTEQLGDEVD
jgi:protein-L-isoaspartate(D-aspartate) O-methyltransferase